MGEEDRWCAGCRVRFARGLFCCRIERFSGVFSPSFPCLCRVIRFFRVIGFAGVLECAAGICEFYNRNEEMQSTPKSLRLQIGIFGRTNVGKSSFLNFVAGQAVAITSPAPGTTTDVVEKAMELLPVGPVVFLDTAGLDDAGALGEARIRSTRRVFDRADVIVVVSEACGWGVVEREIMSEAVSRGRPVVVVLNKRDVARPSSVQVEEIKREGAAAVVVCCSTDPSERERVVRSFKEAVSSCCPDDVFEPPPLLGDLIGRGGRVVMIVPIDRQAPKGRLILPQVMCIRDALDWDGAALVVKETEYADFLSTLAAPPDLVVCDSQVVERMVAETPSCIPCTTFSILFSRLKGDLETMACGAAHLSRLRSGDRILVAESCSHHATEDDIGRVKIPRWLQEHTGAELAFDVAAGREFPANLGEYAAVIHCGACMTNRREVLSRLAQAEASGVPITNYGLCISLTRGVLARVLGPFPRALAAFERERRRPSAAQGRGVSESSTERKSA